MTDRIVVSRYAQALVGYARETIGMDRMLADLTNLRDIMRDNPEFLSILETVEVTVLEKNECIDAVLNEGFSQEVKQFLKLLLAKGRIDKLPEIGEYIRARYSHEGEADAVLKTSFPLDTELIIKIKDALENKYRKKFKLYVDLDASLLGGVRITMGNKVIDGSVRRRLEDLKEKLTAVRLG